MKNTNDIITEAYLSVVNEAYYKKSSRKPRRGEPTSYTLMDVALAVRDTTNNFQDKWVTGGYSGRMVFDRLRYMKSNPTQDKIDAGFKPYVRTPEDTADAKKIIMAANTFWGDPSRETEFGLKVRNILANFMCQSENVGLLAYGIWQAAREAKSASLNLEKEFAKNDKKTITVTVKKLYTKDYDPRGAYSIGYRTRSSMFATHTLHLVCDCDEHSGVTFDIALGAEIERQKLGSFPGCLPERAERSGDSLVVGDKLKLTASVKYVSTKDVTVYMNRPSIVEFIHFEETEDMKWKKEKEKRDKENSLRVNGTDKLKAKIAELKKPILEKFDKVSDKATSETNRKTLEIILDRCFAFTEKDKYLDIVKNALTTDPKAFEAIKDDLGEFFEKVDYATKYED